MWSERVREIMQTTLFESANMKISPGSILLAAAFFILILVLSGLLRRRLLHRLLDRTPLDNAGKYAVITFTRYAFLLLASILAMEIAGIDITALTFLAGAVGIGLGFGLQNIFTNLMSGFLLLLERPIKIGDRVDLGDLAGEVRKIGARSTTIVTNDNITVIVPNSELITQRVTNWSHGEDTVRFRISVGVSYEADPAQVRKWLLEVAEGNSNILKNPAPQVFFDSFGDSSLNFELAVWNRSHLLRPRSFRSDLRYAIHEKLKEKGVEIPYPQRDLHIRSGALIQEKSGPSPS